FYYFVPRELSTKLARDNVSCLWFVDNADNCVLIILWRDNGGIVINAMDIDELRKLSTNQTEVGIQLQQLKRGVFSAEILTMNLVPIEPFPKPTLYAGRILPQDVQDKLLEQYYFRFDARRYQELEEEYCFGEVDQTSIALLQQEYPSDYFNFHTHWHIIILILKKMHAYTRGFLTYNYIKYLYIDKLAIKF
ncbi:hypothetical protein PIB30_050650, partial [Stylosanthes scabra]|nr:hypothetical protein [Stylosanthes scabra]